MSGELRLIHILVSNSKKNTFQNMFPARSADGRYWLSLPRSLSDLLETEGLLSQPSRRSRTVGEPVGGILEMDSSDWSNGIRYHIFDTRPDTEFKVEGSGTSRHDCFAKQDRILRSFAKHGRICQGRANSSP
jgi:hypothetical protein